MALEPKVFDFTWVRGSTTPLRLSFKIDGVAIPHTDIRLSVSKANGKTPAFLLSLADDPGIGPGKVNEITPGVFDFMPTAAQTRSLTPSANDGSPGKNKYEVEIRNGQEENIYLLGTIAGIGGINDDEA
jgi:hypothetical protein